MGKALINMFPKLALNDLMQCCLADAELVSKPLAETVPKQQSNFSDLCLRQFCVVLFFAAPYLLRKPARPMLIAYRTVAHVVSMARIAALSQVFQVVSTVIRSDCVFVIDLVQWRARADERSCHELVDEESPLSVIAIKRDAHVSNRIRARLEQSVPVVVRGIPSNATKIRNGIQVFVIYNSTPLFGIKFFGGKFWISQGVNLHRQGLALVRLVCETPSHARAVRILA